jgi:hypothetical protein
LAAPPNTYLKAVKFQKRDVTGQELDLTQNPSGELDSILRYGAAQVTGTVKSNPVLIPETLNPAGSGLTIGKSDQNGNFTLKYVRPGSYRAVALEGVNQNQLDNPDLLKQLQSLGTEVELKESDNKQISLDRIPATDAKALLLKLGLDLN